MLDNEQEKNVNQTQEPKNSDVAELRKSIEARYEKSFSKKEAAYQSEIESLKAELNFVNNVLPKIESEFSKQNGNKEYFNDFIKLAKDKINIDDLENSMKETLSKHSWAQKSNGYSSVNQQLNWNIKEQKKISGYDPDDYVPGTIYKKRNI